MERGRPGLPGQPSRVPLCALRRAHLASVWLLRRGLVLPETVPLFAQPGLCTGGAFRPDPLLLTPNSLLREASVLSASPW
jgi:hypothetical protein